MKGISMKKSNLLVSSAALIAAVGLGTVAADSQVADPYANNAAAGTLKFPMTAPAGMCGSYFSCEAPVTSSCVT